MNSHRKTAIIVGVLFIIATVAGVISVLSYGSVLDNLSDLTVVAANKNQVIIGSLFYFIMAVAIPAIAIAIYPVIKKCDEAWALGYVGARIGEGLFFILQIMTTLTILTLSQQLAKTVAPGTIALLRVSGDWAYLLGFAFFFTLSALILNYVLYRSKLVPRWLSAWGFIGALLIYVHYLILYFGNNQLNILFLPIALQEMVFAVYLIVKGFDMSAVAS